MAKVADFFFSWKARGSSSFTAKMAADGIATQTLLGHYNLSTKMVTASYLIEAEWRIYMRRYKYQHWFR